MQTILDNITGPNDVKVLNEQELNALCDEIRHKMIDVVSVNGGHLASNLGVVELTVALHKVFDCPRDSFVFDVGHQCYAHKMLTGRVQRFATLRQKDGLSGFPRPTESGCDPFIAGHSSTALSSAIGLARAKQLAGDPSKVVAVIGDGAFASGMVYEAINSLDRSLNNLVVVLNDNSMSISKSVGSISRYLLRLRTNSNYSRLKKSVQRFLGKMPLVGRWITSTILKSKSSFRRSLYGGTLFEEFGFNYVGTVDGHNMDELCRLFSNIKAIDGPILVHAITLKGKGFAPAEQNPGAYHGVGQFSVEKGNPDIAGADSFSNVFGKTLCECADEDTRICGITAAMKYATGLHYFAKHHPERFFDVGIAEEHAVTFCAGLARGGMQPVFSVYATFLQRSFDQLAHDVALSRVPVTLAIDRAGLVGDDGETHQGLLDVAMLRAIGGFTVASPCNYAELRHWTREMIRWNAPSAVRYPRGDQDPRLEGHICTGEPFDWVKTKNRATRLFITYGRIFAEVADAANALGEQGVDCDMIKLNIIMPLDAAVVEAAKQYKHIVFVEEGVVCGGIGEWLLHQLTAAGYKGSYRIQGIEDFGVAQGTVAQQLCMNKLDNAALQQLFL